MRMRRMGAKSAACAMVFQFCALAATVGLLVPQGRSQQITRLDREQAQVMLAAVASDVRKSYYDPKLHGVDWEGKVREAKYQIARASSTDETNAIIASIFETLNDSHTFFLPPRHAFREDYGWRFQMLGNRCYVTQVRPGSDAQTKGIRPGDQVLTINGFSPERASLWRMKYALDVLMPQAGLRVELLDPSGKIHKTDVMASVREARKILNLADVTGRDVWRARGEAQEDGHRWRIRYEELGDDLMILKAPQFTQTGFAVQALIERACKHKTLIFDLRGNPGGGEATLSNYLGSMFEKDVKIADRVTREGTKPLMAKSPHHNAFIGKLIVLVDSESASAAEMFARVVQIEKCGTVLGERTSGSVMSAKYYSHRTGLDPIFYYGALVTEANLVMTDGKSLEHVGVTPDEVILPRAADLAEGRDPVMARAAEMAGVKLSPEQAGKLFPYEWPNE